MQFRPPVHFRWRQKWMELTWPLRKPQNQPEHLFLGYCMLLPLDKSIPWLGHRLFLLRENLHPLAWTKRPVPLLPSLIPLASPGQDSQGDPRHVAINLLPSRTSVPRTYVSARQKGLTEIHISYPDASAHVTYIWHWVYAGKVTAHPLGYKLYVGNSCLNSYLGHAAPRESTQQVFVDWMNKLKRRF